MLSPISTNGLTRYFGNNPAVVDLDLEVESGSFVGYLGPNGAGKSTTIKLLCGLMSPDSGEVYLNGVNASENPQEALKSVGAIIETPEFYNFLTPREQLEYFGRLREVPKGELESRIKEVLQKVELYENIETKIEKFSKGMKQRLGIAQCILHNPEIFLLDEPLLGLDPTGVSEMRDLLNQLKKEGKTVLYSSHILSEVQQVCEEVAIIRNGKLIVHEEIEDLEKEFSANEVEVETLKPLTPDQIEKVRRMSYIESVSSTGKILHIVHSGGEEERAGIIEGIRDAGGKISSFQKKTNLEDLYIKLEEDSLV
ncbi:hypothetical protein AKJ57_00640 [candidate division MSBL1 archaeon SCGC-AAA259A05]|uniref:ABC transporter domain-containing protein n=1 Tax=candidate division MSBL1 archaeon SCGC-AAA259A05 TaxID=1698259 RepID=A0A133UBQ9_9EURY|nr:hypothetical protein AKJ57_00640 [candidate division MSBL1 archaeon SCGC-AAA259A05]